MVEATGARFGVNMISTVAPSGEMRFRLVEDTVNASVFADFIERLAADVGERKLKALDGQLKLFFLPPYSPELNPDELVWSHVNRRIGRAAVTDKDDLKQRLISALRSSQKLPSKIMAFFRHPECRCAAA